ncbi:C-type lectin domain family 2 member D2-like [Rattus rattus]|uniref:C-type lectin domain family 2 member D2-like n=1 Tax=Rattus rattus TaxID=10117 RepID=UPI0013F39523|nr:C-type lectin domain family 2 member D2-like [Rattus rattus]
MLSSAHLQDVPPHLSRTLTQNEEQTSLRQSRSCDPSAASASASESLSGSIRSRIPHSKMLQRKFLRIVSPESPAKLTCYYRVVIIILTVAVVALSVALSVKKTAQISTINTSATCPGNWIGVGNKCFYFNETPSNWKLSQTLCMEQEAELARFDNQEELNFLRRHKGSFDYWIGLHRESSAHPWKWTDNTEYNNLVSIGGVENHGFLSDNGISSSREYIKRNWICSKPNSYTSQCQ